MAFQKNKTVSGVIMVLLAALLWSSNAPFVRWISLDAYTVAGIRSLIAGIVLLPLVRWKKIRFNWYFAGFVLCFLALTFGIIVALKTTATPIAIGMQYISCLWLFLLGRPKKADFVLGRTWPMLLVLAGAIVSMFSKGEGVTVTGNLIALSTSFSFAGMTWFAKKLECENPIGLSSVSNLIMAAVALLIARPTGAELSAVQFTEWLVLVYLGVFQIGAAYSLYYSGLRYVSSATAAMLCPLEMILGPVWTAIFLSELPDAVGAIGFVLVVIGVLGEAILANRHEKKTI